MKLLVLKILVYLGLEAELSKRFSNVVDVTGRPLERVPVLVLTVADEKSVGCRIEVDGLALGREDLDASGLDSD